MKTIIHFIIVMCVITASTPTVGEIRDQIEIVRVGSFHGDQVKAVSGEDWYGLYPMDNGFELIRSEIKVDQVYDAVLDNKDGPFTGKKVTADQPGEPIVLMKGLKELTGGPVKTLFSGRKFMYPAEHMSFKFDEKDYYSFQAFGEVIDRTGEVLINNYTIKFSHQGNSQVLTTFEKLAMDGVPELLWAGDIDRDGKLDFLYDLTYHYNVSLYSLFLSSAAEEGDNVGLVAQFLTTGC